MKDNTVKPAILVTEMIEGPGIESLKNKFAVQIESDLWRTPDKLKTMLPDYDALIIRNQTRVFSKIIEVGSQLRVIGRAGAGLNNIDIEAASEAGIVVTHTPDQNSISVAELSLGMMIALARKLPAANDHVRQGNWQRQHFMGTELYGKILGVVGLGRIGFLTALRAHTLGMDILAHDAYVSPDAAFVTETGADLVELDELLGRADFISSHIPLTSETKDFFSYEQFCSMKSTAFFLNLARGGVVDEPGLIRALDEKQISGAALDVRAEEPPEPSKLSEMQNVIQTPHIAAFTNEAQQRVVAAVARDVGAVLEGDAAGNYVNFARPKVSSLKKSDI